MRNAFLIRSSRGMPAEADDCNLTAREPDHPTGPAVGPILHIGLNWSADRSNGLNRYLGQLATELSQESVPTLVVATGTATDSSPAWLRLGAPDSASLPRRIFAMWRCVNRLSAEALVVDAHFALYAVLPLLFGGVRGQQLVVHFHGPWADESAHQGARNLNRLVKEGVEGIVYRRASRLVVLSESFQRLLVERYGVAPWRISVIPPGVELDRFLPGPKAAARQKLGLAVDRQVVLSVRRLVPRMGHRVLLGAWEAVLEAVSPAPLLLVVGVGPERSALDAHIRRNGLTESVRMLGHVDEKDLADYYRAADLSVLPSLALEGFGLAALESLAAGTPVVATRVGGLPEALEGMGGHPLVEPDDVPGLAQRLVGALNHTAPLADPAQCRSHAERFNWNAVLARHLELYRSSCGTPRTKRLRVVVLDHTAVLSGGELAILRVLPGLVGQADVHFLFGEDGPLVERVVATGATAEVLAMPVSVRRVRRGQVSPGRVHVSSLFDAAWYTMRITRRLRRLRPDLVHTNTLKSALYGGLAARLAGTPCLWHIRDRIHRDYLPGFTVRLVQMAARHLPTHVVTYTNEMRECLGLDTDRASLLVDPVGEGWGDVTTDRPTSPPGQTTFGVVGRLAPWKGQDLFLRSFSLAFPDGGQRAVIVGSAMFGEDTFADSLHKLAAELGIAERITFRGFVDDIHSELATFDVLVHSSVIPEPFGNVVVEGMAAGLPVIAPDSGGPAEVITGGLDGILYPMGDAASLAECLCMVDGDPEMRSRIGLRARQTASGFSLESVAPQLLNVYKKVAGL